MIEFESVTNCKNFQLFVYHESIARSIDEELDNDLVLEDVPDDSNCTDDDGEGHFFVPQSNLNID